MSDQQPTFTDDDYLRKRIAEKDAAIERLRAENERLGTKLFDAYEYAARYDAVMETMNVDFDDIFPDWGAPS